MPEEIPTFRLPTPSTCTSPFRRAAYADRKHAEAVRRTPAQPPCRSLERSRAALDGELKKLDKLRLAAEHFMTDASDALEIPSPREAAANEGCGLSFV